MIKPARVEDDPGNLLLLGLVHAFYQISLVVALKSLQGSALAFCNASEPLVDARKRFLSVDSRLTGTQHVEIGAMGDQYSFSFLRTQPHCPFLLCHKENF